MAQCRRWCWYLRSVPLLILLVSAGRSVYGLSEKEAIHYLGEFDRIASVKCHDSAIADYEHVTDLQNETKKQNMVRQTILYSSYIKDVWKQVQKIPWKRYKNTNVRRQFKLLSRIGSSALPDEKLTRFKNLLMEMTNIYSTATVCPYSGRATEHQQCDLALNPDLENILITSRDDRELAHAWNAWRDVSGKRIRRHFPEYVRLLNEAARLNGYKDAGAMWRGTFDTKDFVQTIEDVWRELRPFYQQLHAYVRRQLIHKYGSDVIREDGPIPAHLLGDMWAQDWGNINDFTKPYPSKPGVDATPKMLEKKMTPLEMFKIAEEFFTSLGLKPMTSSFWKNSFFVKPKDKQIVCHASAWEFCNQEDFRIKMCTRVTMDELITVHHEMGHIQYYMQYAHLALPFREGANAGFHEAIGDALALSVATPQHLKKIGLLDEVVNDKEAEINYLYSVALSKVAFTPFSYLVDLWRWNVFQSGAAVKTFNKSWWKLRLKYQGVCPPSRRKDTDFDPGAKFHVPDSTPYIRYFVSHIVQFQFHKALCEKAGHEGPLHTCDIYKSKEAGKAFAKMLREGSRLPWPDAMEILTGGRNMTAGPLLEYFAPLREWLQEQNKDHVVGWQSDDPMVCP